MILLTVIRHGQTNENSENIIQGQLQTELSELGKIQAQKVAIYLMEKKYDEIITSDLKRAYETAFEISKYQPFAHFSIDPLLRERDFGEYTSMKSDEFVKLGYPEPQKGETKQQILIRAQTFIEKTLKYHQNKKIVVVTHNGFYRALISALQNQQISEMYKIEPLSNTGITEILFDENNNSNILNTNLTKHLEK